MNGIYKECSMEVRIAVANGKKVVNLNTLAKNVLDRADFRNVSEEDLRETYVKHALASTLSRMGWYSVIRGEGYYTELNSNCDRHFVRAIVNNFAEDIDKRNQLIEKASSIAEIDGQMCFNWGEMGYEEEPTLEELLNLLMVMAGERSA